MKELTELAKIAERIERDTERRNELIRATKDKATRRAVANAARLSVARVQQIVGLALLLVLMTASSASASAASHEYQRTWKHDRRYFAPGMPSPLVKFNRRTPGAWAETVFPLGEPRYIKASRGLTRELALRDPDASSILEWEWLRVFGPLTQTENWPAHPRSALDRHNLSALRSWLPHWGENPRTAFDPAPAAPSPASCDQLVPLAGWHWSPNGGGLCQMCPDGAHPNPTDEGGRCLLD